ncbi:uncharacterized protein E1O_19460 [Burkholderiales bacterium GJ-E10]|nr:uncharacterized protein E1O_19460 [Burkholderiales bacterium GJ-E10]
MTSVADVLEFRERGAWRDLARLAGEMVADAERSANDKMNPLLGGGTRIMLAIGHRISDDIDLFIRDAQWIGYLTPRLNDRFESRFSGYDETSTSLKLKTDKGEIDFIVGPSLLRREAEKDSTVPFALEPIEEVVAKKLFYRGWALTPRDLFDWRAVATHPAFLGVPKMLDELLTPEKKAAIRSALDAMATSRTASATWDSIRAPNKPMLSEAIAWGYEQLRDIERGKHERPAGLEHSTSARAIRVARSRDGDLGR